MLSEDFYAHTPGPHGKWHPLVDHLVSVAESAKTFAEAFNAGDLAYCIGLWHDVGKFNPEFQAYLKAQYEGRQQPTVPHAIWGAALAYHLIWTKLRRADLWKLISLPIGGHHTHLAHGEQLGQDLAQFLQDFPHAIRLLGQHLPALPPPPRIRPPDLKVTQVELLIRMLFSTLIDADRLDTERHFDPPQFHTRGKWPTLTDLSARFDEKQRELLQRAATSRTRVNDVRREVYEACIAAASGPQGIYRLTVPTGGGKTRSGLAFALKHALKHDLRRVIIAIPYTSIIDQTVKEYREIFGQDAVVEHHSQVLVSDNERQDPFAVQQRLASENWDAPLIVTTTVQLFESLFANQPSRVRKLHNVAKSVILIDEVQTLPVELLEPTMDVLRTLVDHYGVTIVLSTATQPALDDTPYLKAFLGLQVHEIVPNYPTHFQILRRVDYKRRAEPLTWDAVAEEIREQPQVMVVLNTRRDALALLRALDGTSDLFHLSTLLCGAHRRVVLDRIAQRLQPEQPQPIRLISTQVVEAGVDLDFPVVWRALGPFDRIVQAAGRCNREGKLSKYGQVIIFEPAEGSAPRGPYKTGIEEARILLDRYGPEGLHNPEVYHEYFQRLFTGESLDKKKIQPLRQALNYPEVAATYRLIEPTVPVVVPYGNALHYLDDWRNRPSRDTWQRLQPYLVNLHEREIHRLIGKGMPFVPVSEGLYEWVGAYDETLGLKDVFADPADLFPTVI